MHVFSMHTWRKIEFPFPASCAPTIIHRKPKLTPSDIWLCEFTYWLARGCCTHWWEGRAGLVVTGSPACVGRSTSRWAPGSHWGGDPVLGCLCPPWWQKSTFSHKTDLKGKPPEQVLWVSLGSWVILILHWTCGQVDISKKSSNENGSMFLIEHQCLLSLMSHSYNPVGFTNVCFEGWVTRETKLKRAEACRTFYPSFLCYCEISWKALFARGVGVAGTLTAILYLCVKRMMMLGGKWQKKQVSSSTGDFGGNSREQWRGW